MTLNTRYSSLVSMWVASDNPFNAWSHLKIEMGRVSVEQPEEEREQGMKRHGDFINFCHHFGDPRLEYNGDMETGVKEHWYPVFRKWCLDNGKGDPDDMPHHMFLSYSSTPDLVITVDDISKLKELGNAALKVVEQYDGDSEEIEELKKHLPVILGREWGVKMLVQ